MGRGGHYIYIINEDGTRSRGQWISNKKHNKMVESASRQQDVMSLRRNGNANTGDFISLTSNKISLASLLNGNKKNKSEPSPKPVTVEGTRSGGWRVPVGSKITMTKEGQKPITMTKVSSYIPGDGHYFETEYEVWKSPTPERAAELYVQAHKDFEVVKRNNRLYVAATDKWRVGGVFEIIKG